MITAIKTIFYKSMSVKQEINQEVKTIWSDYTVKPVFTETCWK